MATKKKGCCDKDKETKEKDRRELVAAALSTAYFASDEERASAVESFTKANLSIEEILMLTEGLRDITKNASKGRSKIFGSNSKVPMGGGIY